MSHAQVIKYLNDVRASYWFIPSVMAVTAILLSLITVHFDGEIKSDWAENFSFLFASQPEGARALLSTVAGSMITVAGVTFSLTLLAVSHSTGQFGPRVLNNFMRDRGNQFTLGTFIATFLYCLLILRTVRSAEEMPVGTTASEFNGELAVAFVPQISLTVALAMTLCSVGVLIYFIHHIPESIRLSNVVSGIGRHLKNSIDELFPEMIASGHQREDQSKAIDDLPENFFGDSAEVIADKSGYVQAVDDAGLLRLANDHDLLVFISRRPGDFHCEGKELARVWPTDKLNDDLQSKIRNMFALGVHRTYTQNVMFSVDQLVEIAQRALSPGVNDPMTAMYSMDWLQTALVNLTRRDSPQMFRYNEEGTLRIFAETVGFDDFCSRIFDQLRQYVAPDRNAAVHMMKILNEVRDSSTSEPQRSALDRHAKLLIDAAENSSPTESDFDELKRLYEDGIDNVVGSRQKFETMIKKKREKVS